MKTKLIFILILLASKMNAQEFCSIYELMLDTLKKQRTTYIELGNVKIDPTILIDTFPKIDTTYFYSFFIPEYRKSLTERDLRIWFLYKLNAKKVNSMRYKLVNEDILKCKINKTIKFKVVKQEVISPMFDLPYNKDDLNRLGEKHLPLRLWFSNILTKRNNAFAFVECVYPFKGNNKRQFYFWFKRKNKLCDWNIYKMIGEYR